jgi:hypothetical protein
MSSPRRQFGEIVPRDLRRLCSKGCLSRRLLHCRLPPILPGTTLAELALPARARKYFERRKYIQRPAAAAKLTLGELANTRGLGVGSIVETVEALYRCAEARGFKPPPPASKRTKRKPRPPLHAPRSLGRQTTRAGRIPSALRGCRLPPLPAEAKLADLRLRGRARRFLQQGAYLADRAALSELTIAELLDHTGLG